MLTSKVLKQKPLNASMLHELQSFLEFLIKRHKDDPLTEQQVADLFTQNTPHSDYLVMRQRMRDIGEITHNRNSGISATYNEGRAIITPVNCKLDSELARLSTHGAQETVNYTCPQ